MNTNHKPATALPWREANTNSGFFLAGATPGYFLEVRPTKDAKQVKQDAAYIAHACNAYPELVEALRELVARCDGAEGVRADGSNIQTHNAHGLLAKLGEAA